MRKTLLLLLAVLFFAVIASCSKTAVNPDESINISNKILSNSLNNAQVNNIVILGGSTAWGKGASAPQYTWVNRLSAKLKAVDKKDTIINLAIPGYTTYHIMPTGSAKAQRPECDTDRNITTALRLKPMLVIISLPSNDIAAGYTDDEIINNYKKVVELLKAANVPYILTSNQPRDFGIEQRVRLRTFTDLLIKTFPNHVVDYLNTLGDSFWYYKRQYNCGDGIHPNNSGHEAIYKAFINYAPFKKIVGM